MDYSNFKIEYEQAEKIAMSIYSDIATFIQENKEDYELWLKQEEFKEQKRKEG